MFFLKKLKIKIKKVFYSTLKKEYTVQDNFKET